MGTETPSTPIVVNRLVHLVQATWDYHACRRRYMDVFGAIVFAENYDAQVDRDMNLFYVGELMIETVAPRNRPGPIRQFIEKYGEGWHSFEFGVDDLPSTLAALDARGVRYTEGVPFLHRRSTGGLMIALWDGPMPNDPALGASFEPTTWHRGNPLSLEGLDAVIVAVTDLTAARDALADLCGSELIDMDRSTIPEPVSRCRVRIAGTDFLLISPIGGVGPVSDALARRKDGIYSVAWRVGSLEQARRRLSSLGVALQSDTSVLGGMTIDPQHLFGAAHELVESDVTVHACGTARSTSGQEPPSWPGVEVTGGWSCGWWS